MENENTLSETNSYIIIKNQISNKIDLQESRYKKSQTLFIKESHVHDDIILPSLEQRDEVFNLEKELFGCLNLKWGIDFITEDIPIVDGTNNNYYMHLVRTAKPDPNKENFLLIHGFLSSNLHFLSILPFLIKRYNVFIPDTIGMGLSSRPQITFNSPIQCEDYFISMYHLLIKNLFFEGRFNIKKEYYLCGHSLGGFIASRYMLRFPIGIKKALLLSPAGITDYNIPGTYFFAHSSCGFYCSSIFCSTFVWPCGLRVQNLYNCCLCHEFLRNNYGIWNIKLDEDEIKKNKDGTKFIVNYKKLLDLIHKIVVMSLEYPKDLYKCVYYLFKVPPPAAVFPIETKIAFYNKIPIIFCFGENDFMDRTGSYRLVRSNPELYKIFTISKAGHSFALHNPKELCMIIEEFFDT